MGFLNTNKSVLFLYNGSTLPVAPAYFLETTDATILSPTVDTETFKRVSAKLGNSGSYTDVNKNMYNLSVSHTMRESNSAQDALNTEPEYGELLKTSGFDVVIDNATAGQETVTYKNSQSPTKSSLVHYLDGKKSTMTNCVVGDITITGVAGQKAIISGSLQGYADNAGITVNEVAPTTALTSNDVLGLTTVDIITVGGVSLTADQFVITTNPEITNIYGTGTKEHNIDDYDITLEVSYFVDEANYTDAIQALNISEIKAIDIKLGTATGSLVSGKSVHITADVAQSRSFNDSMDQNKVKRTFTYGLQLDSNDIALSIKHGYFA